MNELYQRLVTPALYGLIMECHLMRCDFLHGTIAPYPISTSNVNVMNSSPLAKVIVPPCSALISGLT